MKMTNKRGTAKLVVQCAKDKPDAIRQAKAMAGMRSGTLKKHWLNVITEIEEHYDEIHNDVKGGSLI